MYKGAGKCDALLLARRKLERPMASLVESSGQVWQAYRFESLPQSCVVDPASRHRIAYYFSERADRQVGLLRQKKNSSVTRSTDLAAPKRPDSGDGTKQRALSRTRGAPQENGVS